MEKKKNLCEVPGSVVEFQQLYSHKNREERINKAGGAFFAHRQLGSFHSQLIPLSLRSLIEKSHWILLCLFGCMNPSFGTCDCQELQQIASLHNSRLAIYEMPLSLYKAVLSVPSLPWRYKHWHIKGRTLSYSDIEALDLIKQCHLLELPYSTNFII